jgi:hypothetical protein
MLLQKKKPPVSGSGSKVLFDATVCAELITYVPNYFEPTYVVQSFVFLYLIFAICLLVPFFISFCRAEEVGYVIPTDVQEQSLPVLLSRQDCVLHAQVMFV